MFGEAFTEDDTFAHEIILLTPVFCIFMYNMQLFSFIAKTSRMLFNGKKVDTSVVPHIFQSDRLILISFQECSLYSTFKLRRFTP